MTVDKRIGSLSSILSSKPARHAPLAPPEQTSSEPESSHESKDVSERARRPQGGHDLGAREESAKKPLQQKRSRPTATSSVHRRVVCRILQDSHDQISYYARAHNVSHGAVVLQAVEKAYVDDAFSSQDERASFRSSLFVGAAAEQVRPASARVTLDVRLHAQDVQVLDRLVTEHGLRDRTDLINQALDHFLATAVNGTLAGNQ